LLQKWPRAAQALASVLLLFLLAGCDRGASPGMVGQPAPAVVVHDGSRTLDLQQYRGRVVLLNFWATWCQPCVEELPSLEALHQQMPQLAIVAISEDKDAAEYAAFLRKHPLPFELAREGTEDAAERYHTDGYPETFVIDHHGIVRRHFVGPQDWTSPALLAYLRGI